MPDHMDFSMPYNRQADLDDPAAGTKDFVARVRAGDTIAFGEIFNLHSRFVYKFIYAMLGEPSLAEELKQETFLAAYRSIHSLRDESKLKTWLCGIAKNLVLKFLRGRRKEGINSGLILEEIGLADQKTIAPDRAFLSKELSWTIRATLAELDEDKRLVFVLKELQHLSYREISEITGHAIPKLKTDLRRSKIEMCRALRPYLEAER